MKIINNESILAEYTIRTPYIVSVNSMYEPILDFKVFGNTRVSSYHGLRLSEDAVNLKYAIKTELEKANASINQDDIDWNKPFIFALTYILSTSFMRRDCGNLEKCVTDAIFDYFGLNDNRICALHQYKLFTNKKGSEYIKFRLSQPNLRFNDLRVNYG